MRRVFALLLVFLVVGSTVSTGFAEVYLREVPFTTPKGKKDTRACNRRISWVQSGNSVELSGSHQFGGFLGMFTQTCNYKYREYYEHYQCTSGHVQRMNMTVKTYNHSSCGK